MNKEEFINKVEATHKEYETAFEGLSTSQLMQPKTCGEWSVKDVIAHVSWHEQQMVGVLATRTLGGSPWWNLSLEERNARIHAEIADRPVEEVLREAREVFQDLLKHLVELNEEDLHTAKNFKDMPEDWKPWEVIASNTFEHYPEHARDILAAFPDTAK